MGALRASASGTYLLQAIVSLVAGGVLLFLPSASARTLLMVFGGWALLTGVSQILAVRRASVEDAARGLTTTIGGAVAAIGLVLLIWPGTGVVAISWIIALAALLLAALLIFLALRLKRLKKRVDNLAPLRSAE
jgi:uncharacterized membrane protein HdeD (DUF308 family)